jgi:hypothetical protein
LCVKAITIFAGVGGDELFEELTVDLRTVSWQIACLGISPKTARPKRRDLAAELGPGPAGETVGYAIPVHAEGAGFRIATIVVERAARPA